MKEVLAITGSIIAAVSFLPYLKDTLHKKIKPRIASWFTWSLITGIATIASISAHAYTSALLSGAATLVEVSVLILALRNGDMKYKWIDGGSQAISLFGIVAWVISKDPAYAIAFSILADFFGGVPTLYHGWVKPHEEAWLSFVIFGAGSFLTVFGVTKMNFTNLAIPIYFTIIATSIGANIFFRQKIVKA